MNYAFLLEENIKELSEINSLKNGKTTISAIKIGEGPLEVILRSLIIPFPVLHSTYSGTHETM